MGSRETFIVLSLALVIPVIGIVAEVLQAKYRLRGYRAIAPDLRVLSAAIHGQIMRDAADIVVRGSRANSTVFVRFSQSEEQPALNVSIPAGSNVTLYCVPSKHEGQGGRATLRTGDDIFDSRFRISTDEPAEAKVLMSPDTVQEIHKLCGASSSTFLSLENGSLELNELALPESDVAGHAIRQVESMAKIAHIISQMPGAKEVAAVGPSWNWFRAIYVGLSIVLILSVAVVAGVRRTPAPAPKAVALPPGISAAEAAQVAGLERWRLAQPSDFDANALSWMRQGSASAGHMAIATRDGSNGIAYILKPNEATAGVAGRLLMFDNGKLRFDINFPEMAIAARIPRDDFQGIAWNGRPPVGDPDSDGVLIVRRLDAPDTGMIFFYSGLQVLSGRPRDFQSLPLR